MKDMKIMFFMPFMLFMVKKRFGLLVVAFDGQIRP